MSFRNSNIDQEALLQTIYEHPEDDVARLVYADWLEESGQPAQIARAHFIRFQIASAQLPSNSSEASELRLREAELQSEYGHLWDESLVAEGISWVYRRGFLWRLSHRGLYRCLEEGYSYSYYIRFYPNGTVITVSSRRTPQEISEWFNLSFPGIGKGQYTLRLESHVLGISFESSHSEGTVDYRGCLFGSSMLLDSHSRINGHRCRQRYQWVDVPDYDSAKEV
jgi:uncharacterized protein (TIGR02996 family)